MQTTHITTFATAIAERRRSTEDEISRCKDQLDDARDTLGATEETIRAYEREIERLRQFQTLGLEHVQQLEFNLSRLTQYREGCAALLIEAEPQQEASGKPGFHDRRLQREASGPFSKHLGPNGAA
jgi:TolA-binding protein